MPGHGGCSGSCAQCVRAHTHISIHTCTHMHACTLECTLQHAGDGSALHTFIHAFYTGRDQVERQIARQEGWTPTTCEQSAEIVPFVAAELACKVHLQHKKVASVPGFVGALLYVHAPDKYTLNENMRHLGIAVGAKVGE